MRGALRPAESAVQRCNAVMCLTPYVSSYAKSALGIWLWLYLVAVYLEALEARLWLEIARVVRSRWERRDNFNYSRDSHYEVETLWSNDDVQSVEVQNYVY